MVKSMFAGVSGLKAHQRKMDVIGNNIANVNTWGYKAYSFNFQDSIYSTSVRSSGGETTTGAYGGRNPSQVGYGSTMSSISFQYTTGAPSPTDNDLDCMIDGTGLFLVGGMVSGQLTANGIKDSGLYLSRVGIFSVDNNGYLVDDQKNYVYGYALKDGTGIPEVTAKPYTAEGSADIVVADDATNAGKKTVTILGITVNNISKVNGSDTEVYKAYLRAWRNAVMEPQEVEADGVTPVAGTGGVLSGYTINDDGVSIPSNGGTPSVKLTIIAKQMGDGVTGIVPAAVFDTNKMTNAYNANMIDTWEITDGQNYEAGVPAEFNEDLSPIQIPYDPKTGLQYNLQSYSISDNGVITGIDTQNRPITLGQLAIVAVENPNGMEKTNGYYFQLGDNAGGVEVVKPGSGAAGFIRSKYLEMPNVDLANEFSNMITTQRGFQANSKIITVTDEMLQELVNMKR